MFQEKMEQPIIVNLGISKTFILYDEELSCCLEDIIESGDCNRDIPQEKLTAGLKFLGSMLGSIKMIAYKDIVVRRRNTKLFTITRWRASLTPEFLNTIKNQIQKYTLKHEISHSQRKYSDFIAKSTKTFSHI